MEANRMIPISLPIPVPLPLDTPMELMIHACQVHMVVPIVPRKIIININNKVNFG